MSTPKISVWAFNEFAKFDSLISLLGCAPQEAEYDYSRTDKVKMVNTTHHFNHDLNSFLEVLAIELTDAEMDTVRASLFKKNGEIRKLEGKTVKFVSEEFFVMFDF